MSKVAVQSVIASLRQYASVVCAVVHKHEQQSAFLPSFLPLAQYRARKHDRHLAMDRISAFASIYSVTVQATVHRIGLVFAVYDIFAISTEENVLSGAAIQKVSIVATVYDVLALMAPD